MLKHTSPPRRAISTLLIALGLAAGSALAQPSPTQLIRELGAQTRAAADGRVDHAQAAEAAAAAQVRTLVEQNPGHAALTEPDANGATPLMQAAVNGYAEVVDALLADAGVRAGIDRLDRQGASAWMLSQFARPLTLLSCHPQAATRERALLWLPLQRRAAYFVHGQTTAFERIGTALVKAGARADVAAAKAAWLARCPGHDAATAARIAQADNLLVPLLRDSESRLSAFLQALRANELPTLLNTASPIVARPPKPANAAASPKAGMICTKMERPQAPPINWRGEVTLQLTAEVHAGLPAVAQIRVIDGHLDPRTEAVMHTMLLQALSGYDCPGDHLFDQEFRFKVQ